MDPNMVFANLIAALCDGDAVDAEMYAGELAQGIAKGGLIPKELGNARFRALHAAEMRQAEQSSPGDAS